MHTRQNAEAYIIEAIEHGDVEDAAAEYEIEAIADDLYEATGTWYMGGLDDELFWWTIQRHAKNTEAQEAAGERPTSVGYKTDRIACGIIDTREKIRGVRMDLDALESESDQLIVRAYRTGAFTQKRLAELAGISQQRVAQILAK